MLLYQIYGTSHSLIQATTSQCMYFSDSPVTHNDDTVNIQLWPTHLNPLFGKDMFVSEITTLSSIFQHIKSRSMSSFVYFWFPRLRVFGFF